MGMAGASPATTIHGQSSTPGALSALLILTALLKSTSDLLKLLARKSAHRLRTYAALSDSAENQASRSLVIWGFGNYHVIVLPHDKIEPDKLSPGLSGSIIERL